MLGDGARIRELHCNGQGENDIAPDSEGNVYKVLEHKPGNINIIGNNDCFCRLINEFWKRCFCTDESRNKISPGTIYVWTSKPIIGICLSPFIGDYENIIMLFLPCGGYINRLAPPPVSPFLNIFDSPDSTTFFSL